ncbi:hypothetical protein SS50377_24122 [Spironucleus salmonicida]|uniref:Uncharacterized protein n=1 Tax=Spironucleus salmonicida TaxID=348837 RepID=A0A9P8RYU4_9EUKA|nr:hypothetical protein SS50377_24122 [Spironucleus salmonicida]
MKNVLVQSSGQYNPASKVIAEYCKSYDTDTSAENQNYIMHRKHKKVIKKKKIVPRY